MLRYLSAHLFLCIFLFSNTSCQSNKYPDYAQRAYLEQQAERKNMATPQVPAAPNEEDLVLNLESEDNSEWFRQSYESIDEWLYRIQELLELNHDAIKILQSELEHLSATSQDHITSIQAFVHQNNQLQEMIQMPIHEEHVAESGVQTAAPPPFQVHFVRPGDTLYSIALKYYGTSDKIRDIMVWNRGWLRHPDDLIAGLSIILFNENAPEKKQVIVEEYIDELNSLLF